MPTATAGHRQSQANLNLTEDKNNLLTAQAAAVNNVTNMKSRSERTHAGEEIFMILGEKTPPSTPLGPRAKSGRWKICWNLCWGSPTKTVPPFAF